MAEQNESTLVRNVAIIATIITVIFVLALLVPEFRRDKWEVDNLSRVLARIEEAKKLPSSGFMESFSIYEEVLSEASTHAITNDALRQALDDAASNKDRLYPRVQEKLKREEVERKRLALSKEQRTPTPLARVQSRFA